MAEFDHTVVVANDFDWVDGGASAVALETAGALRSSGFDAIGLFGTSTGSQVSFPATRLSIEPAGGPSTLLSNLWNFETVKAVRKLRKEYGPQLLLHVHGWTKCLSPSLFWAAHDSGIPVVITAHEYYLVCPNGGYYNFQTQRSCQEKPLGKGCLTENCDSRSRVIKGYRVLRSQTQRLAGAPSTVSGLVFISQASRDLLEQLDPGLRQIPSKVIRSPGRSPEPPDSCEVVNRRFVFVGRLEAEKGVEDLVWAAKAAGLRRGELLFVGDGSLASLVRDELGPDAVTGWLSASEVESYVKSSGALILGSRWNEPYGLVVDEAARLGRAVIAPVGTDAERRATDGRFGISFSHEVPGSLARSLGTMNPALAKTLGQAARVWYETNWMSAQRYVNELVALYSVILDG